MNCSIAEQYIQVSVLLQNKSTSKGSLKLGVRLQAARYLVCPALLLTNLYFEKAQKRVIAGET